jgi:hypothetical protein
MYMINFKQIDVVTIGYKLLKDGELLRDFKLKIGDSYVVEPINKNKLKHRGRKCTITGYEYDDLNNAKKARVKFHDTDRYGKVDLEDFNKR